MKKITITADLATGLFTRGKGAPGRDAEQNAYGIVTRAVVRDGVGRMFNEDTPAMTLRAERLVVDRRNHKPRFLQATLEDARSDRRVSSREIIWDAVSRTFQIRGGAGPLERGQKGIPVIRDDPADIRLPAFLLDEG